MAQTTTLRQTQNKMADLYRSLSVQANHMFKRSNLCGSEPCCVSVMGVDQPPSSRRHIFIGAIHTMHSTVT